MAVKAKADAAIKVRDDEDHLQIDDSYWGVVRRAVKDTEILHITVVTGGGPDSVEWPYCKWVNTMISNVKKLNAQYL